MKTDEKVFLNREPAEPTAGLNSAAIPIWLTGLLAVLLYWSCTFTDTRGGRFSPLVYAPYTSTNQLVELLPKSGDDDFLRHGKMVFNKNCAPCHQDSGSGNPSTFVPPVAGSEIVAAAGPNRLIRILLDGLAGPIKVAGKDYGTAAMPPWRPAMNDYDVAAVLTYIRGSWGNKATPVMPEQVAPIREKDKAHSDPWQWSELEKIPEKD